MSHRKSKPVETFLSGIATLVRRNWRVLRCAALALTFWVLTAGQTTLAQQIISPNGANALTNQTGTAAWAYYRLTLPTGYAGLALTTEHVSGAGPIALFVRGGTQNPTEAVYDYQTNNPYGTNVLEFSPGALPPGEYRIGMLFQGANAGDLAQNRLRLIPLLSPSGGALTNQVVQGQDLFFRLTVPAGYPGFRAVLVKTNDAGTELSAWRGTLPPGPTLIRAAVGNAPETVWATETETTNGSYLLRIAGLATGTNTVSLYWEQGYLKTLTWDPGTADAGTQIYTNASNDPGGLRFFRLNAQDSIIGAWRTVLRVPVGSAEFYMQNGALPFSGSTGNHAGATSNSARIFYTGQYSAGQDWYITVQASPGAQWSLFSGEAYAQDLGRVQPPDPDPANTSIADGNTAAIGPEGLRFYRTIVTNGTPAWRLWLNSGGSNPTTVPRFIEVRQTQVAPPGQGSPRQLGQMLVVPPDFLQANSTFITVSGNQGDVVNLDSRVQRIEDLPFGTTTPTNELRGFLYRTFRVQVVDTNALGWQINATTITGDVDLSLRKSDVGNELNYLAFSKADGLVGESITIVPPTFSDGAYFITVYAKSPSTFQLRQNTPQITEVPFVNGPAVIPGYGFATGPVIVNDAANTNRNGWRYYRVSDIPSQLGVLGWFLQLSNQTPNTEIALRRNALPARWSTGSALDYSSAAGFLERQAHQADVWYIGINSPVLPLGAFELRTRPFLPTAVDQNSPGAITVNQQNSGSWQYFELNLTNALGDPNLRALEIQLTNVSGGGLRTQIRRDAIPYDVGAGLSSANNSWPSGAIANGGTDWTTRNRPGGNSDYLFLPLGWPLQPGHYFIGVKNESGQPRTYDLRFSQVGSQGSGKDQEILTLANSPGASVTNVLDPRGYCLYRLGVTNGTRMLRLQLRVTQGEARLFIRRNQLPGLPGAVASDPFDDTRFAQVARPGSEIVTLLPPEQQTTIPAGDYYLLVAAEGTLANYAGADVGTGPTGYELSVLPEFLPTDLGAFGPGRQVVVETNFLAPERRFYTIDIQPGVKALELRFEDLGGNAYLQWASGPGLLLSENAYGWMGGWGNYQRITGVQNLIPPAPGRYSFVIESRAGAAVPVAAQLTIATQDSTPLAAVDGTVGVTNQPSQAWRFFQVDVPDTAGGAAPAAWDVKLSKPTSQGLQLTVARGNFPSPGGMSANYFSTLTTWPTNLQVAGDYDLTYRTDGPGLFANEMHLGWGRPVAAGTYFIGIYNGSGQSESYQLSSRLIGGSISSLPKRIEDLAWNAPGTLATVSNLPAGEARYFRLPVPPGTPMLRLKLAQLRGEARMIIRRGSVPGTHLYGGVLNGDSDFAAMTYARVGDEEMSILARSQTTALPPGDYFITVISEGQNPPDNNTLGTNGVDLRLERLPDIGTTDLGTLLVNVPLVFTNVTAWPDRSYYRLTIPAGARTLRIALQNLTNAPTLWMGLGTNLLDGSGPAMPNTLPPGGVTTWYGGEGALYGVGNGYPNPLTLNNPTPGVYTLLVDAGRFTTTAAAVTFDLAGDESLDFSNGEKTTTQPGQSWRYYRVEVPTNAATNVLGWEVRLADSPSDEGWTLLIRRDELPPGGAGVGDGNTSWPSGATYGGSGADWTGRAIPGMRNSAWFASLAWGRPLQPGTYFVGVYNGSAQPRFIRLLSHAIGRPGSGLPIQVGEWTNLTTMTISNQAAGTFRYFHLTNAPGIPALKFKLRTLQGDARWQVRRAAVPGILAAGGSLSLPGFQVRTDVAGNDYMIWWPDGPDTTLPADDYYFVIAAEGSPTNPDNGLLGTGNSSYEISSSVFQPENLGQVTPQNPLIRDAGYDAGEVLAYKFDAPPGTSALEVRLENRVGSPVFELGRGGLLGSSRYGWFGANYTNLLAGNVTYFTLTDLPTNTFWLTASHFVPNTPPAAGSFQLRVRSLLATNLNFSGLLNTNHQTNLITASLADGQRMFFNLDVPAFIGPEAILGWYLKLNPLLGRPQVRIRPGLALPQDSVAETSGFNALGFVVVPPYLRPGPWTIEVKAVGDSQFTLSSERVTLERPAWTMPAAGQVPNTPGLAAPLFGDSSVLTNGTLLTNDVSLAQDRYHFYAVDVPEGNAGLIRAELITLSGNPDLYVRAGNLPSLEAAVFSTSYNAPFGFWELSLNSGAISESANWVPTDTKRELQLTPGRWYFMVQASGSTARYRLKVGTGQVTDLAFNGGSANAQNLAANDWRYYRFLVPTNPPQFWNLTVSQQQGDVDMFIRDTAPPGVSYGANPATWREAKNAGVNYLDYANPGTWQFTVPQLRPGRDGGANVYYVGVKAAVDSVFSISSSTSGLLLSQAYPNLDFINPEGGSVALTLNPFERRTWRVRVPDDALRWKTVATNSALVRLYLQNGSVPWAARDNPADHWSSGGAANSQFETPLSVRTQGGWPWVRGETFYVSATNESALAQDFYLQVDTRAWLLSLLATNGTIQPSPNKPYYNTGESVTLLPVPATGYRFAGWAGDLSGTNQPAQIIMTTNRQVTALFEPVPYHINITATGGVVAKVPDRIEYHNGDLVHLIATPNPGFEFDRWSGDIPSFLTDLPIIMSGDLHLTAIFRQTAFGPVITNQPRGGTFLASTPLTLSVSASGTQPLVYQWRKNSQPLNVPGTPDLTIASLTTNDVGWYSVFITNVAGQALSEAVAVNVQVVRNTTFSNNTPILIRDHTNALPYPSPIAVSGVSGSVSNVVVTFHNLSHSWLEDVDALVVAPGGQSALVMSDVAQTSVSNVTLALNQEALDPLPEFTGPASGSYRPADYAGIAPPSDWFNPPAPTGPYVASLAGFRGLDPNGSWQLFIMDDFAKDNGIMAGGWSVTFQIAEIFRAVAPPSPIQATAITDSSFSFNLVATPGTQFLIEVSNNLLVWDTYRLVTVPANGSTNLLETLRPEIRQKFYRVTPQ